MIRRSVLTAAAAVSALAVTAYATFAQAPPPLEAEKYLPAGKTIAFVAITDMKTADGVFQGTDLGAVWKTLEGFRQELARGFDVSLADAKKDFEKETGVAFDDALALLQGGVAAGLVDMAPPEAKDPRPMPVLAVAPQFRKALEGLQKKQTPPTEPGQPPAQPPFQLVDKPGTLLVVLDPKTLAEAGQKTLADDPNFRAVKAKLFGPTGIPVVLAYGNAESVIARAMAHDPKAKDEMAKVGVDGVNGVGLGIGFADGRLREALVVTSPGPRTGLVKAVTAGKALDVASLARSAPADCVSFWAGRFDAKLVYDEVIAAVKAIEPDAAQEVDQNLAKIEQEMGLKVVDDILAPLGDSFTIESLVPEDGLLPEAVLTIQLRDPARFEATIAKLTKKAGLDVKTVARGGKQVKYLQAPLGKLGGNVNEEKAQLGVVLTSLLGAWVLDGSTLYSATLPQTLEDRFERMAKGSLGDTDQFKGSLSKAPQNARFFTWGKTRPLAGMSYHVALKLLRAFEAPARQAGVPIDTALLPRPRIFAGPWLPSSSTLVVDEEGLAIVNQGGVPVLSFIPALAVLGFQEKRKEQAQAARFEVEMALRTVYGAQQQYYMEKNAYAKSIEELIGANTLPGFAPPAGYQLMVTEVNGQKFTVEARPMDPSKPHMIIDQTGYARGYGEPNPFGESPEPPRGEEPAPPPPTGGEGEGEGGNK